MVQSHHGAVEDDLDTKRQGQLPFFKGHIFLKINLEGKKSRIQGSQG